MTRISIHFQSWIRIRIHLKSWIRIRRKSMRYFNADTKHGQYRYINRHRSNYENHFGKLNEFSGKAK
jgi:macrodomain Ter protein organizer (MatP/YcbG family)